MAWRDRLRRASYKNREFHVSQSTGSFGRRTVLHEFPGRDTPFNEDLGRQTRTFTFDSYVIGPDHDRTALALKDAFESEGVGELVHPFLGTYYGTASVEIRQSFQSDLGMTYLNISFTEDGNNDYSTAQINPSRVLSRDAFSLRDVGLDYFNDILTGISLANSLFNIVNNGISSVFKNNRSFSRIDVSRLTSSPRDVAVDVSDNFFNRSELSNPRDRFNLILSQSKEISDAIRLTRTQGVGAIPAQRNQVVNAVADMVDIQAVAAASNAASRASWESYQGAIESRGRIVERLDAISETANDDVYLEIRKIKESLNKVIPGDDNSVVNLVNYTPRETLPALVLSYRLYGDESKDSEIIEQNNIENPNMVTGGKTIAVRVNDDG